ncbi:MAG: sulfurtransferase [Chloroflexota bacterium]
MYKTLISLRELADNYTRPNWVLVDCHFQLDDPDVGREAYLRAHIPGAFYAHLDRDLSGPIIPGKTGRHPLPAISVLAETLSHWGIDKDTQVVAYDNRGGAIAVRLWWMLKWLGHHAVAVLDGGFNDWQQAGHPVDEELPQPNQKIFSPQPQPEMIATVDEIETIKEHPDKLLIDSRAPERYRGEVEPLDSIAGHIPGAVNHFFKHNLGPDEKMITVTELKENFSSLIGDTQPNNVIFYCGSGVTSAHNVLAMAHAGLGFARIYPGSWSEWITDPNHEICIVDE